MLLLGVVHLALAQTKTVRYLPSDEVFENPERGFYRVEETGMTPGKISPYEPLRLAHVQNLRKTSTLLFRYFGLKQWRTVPLPDTILKLIDDDFSVVRAAGMKCIVRFTYSAAIGEPDAPLEIILRHIEQLTPILRKNRDVLAVMQAGFIGAWGEWHSSSHGNDSPEKMRIVLFKLLDSLPNDRMIQVRTPRYKQSIFSLPYDANSALPSSQAFSGTPLSRVGHHNDCFLADDNDMGTYWRNNRNDTASAKAYLQRESRFVPVGGETCQKSRFAHCTNALAELRRLRWSFLNANYNTKVLDGFREGGCLEEMKKKLGYRFTLLRSEFTPAVAQYGTFRFAMTLVNTGWASLYNPRRVELLLRHNRSGTVYSARLRVDPRWWQAGDTVEVSAAVGIPAMKAGTYSLLLNLPDPDSLLHVRPEYSIRCANKDVWEPATGYNNLLDSVSISGAASSARYAGADWFQPVR